MLRLFHASALFAIAMAGACHAPATPDYGRALPEGAPALLPLDPHEPGPSLAGTWVSRDDLLPALERSIAWTRTEQSKRFFPVAGIDHALALASLVRFQELLTESTSPRRFEEAVRREFQIFKSAGWDGRGGGVLFTGYCTPILRGARRPDETFRYPLYSLPTDLEKGPDGTILGQRTPFGLRQYPTRRAVETGSLLAGRGLELVWLADPLDAYIAHVNGSAFVELQDGQLLRLGYSGKNGRLYRSLGKELVNEGHLKRDEVSLAAIRRWAREHPEQLEEYLLRNDSYVFFTPIEGNPRGSLNVEVQAERSLATDKQLFPRGALVFVETTLPEPGGGKRSFERMMLDQDTGGAIRTAGRADIYLGVGPEAEARAGATRAEGQMYYLFLRDLEL